MLNIGWIPYWRPIKFYASSRIRCWFHHLNINKYFNNNFKSTFNVEESDIVIINQNIDKILIKYLYELKRDKKIIIFDIVDNHYKNNPTLKFVFQFCDYIFVSNKIQKEEIEDFLKIKKKIFIIPDCIDYPEYLDTNISDISNNIAWFGNNTNEKCLDNFIPIINELGYNLNLIGNLKYLKNKYSNTQCNIIEWNYDTFISELKKNFVTILCHNQKQKSNNKLLVSIANGVPVISYNSISYSQLLEQFDLNNFIIERGRDLINSLEILSRPDDREQYLSKIQPYILRNYSDHAATERLIEVIGEISDINPITRKIKSRKRILVYTANFGDYDEFHDLNVKNENIDYIYITDNQNINSNKWKILHKNGHFSDHCLNSKIYKILPHEFFFNYDYSIWIDSSSENIISNFEYFIELLEDYDFIISKHPHRNCLYEECEICIKDKKDSEENITKAIDKYKNLEFPKDYGLFACGFMVRKHMEQNMIDFSKMWWEEITNSTIRDQISFPYVYEQFKDKIKFKIIDFKDLEKHFKWKKHKKDIELEKQEIEKKKNNSIRILKRTMILNRNRHEKKL